MAAADRDSILREAAANRGLKLVKSRRRIPGKGDYGRYGLTDGEGRKLFGFGSSGLTASPEEIEEYLHKGAAADWKSSLSATGAKLPPRRSKRAAGDGASSSRRLKPEPPLSVRKARSADAEAIAALVAGLGFPASARDLVARLASLGKAGEPPLVAERGEVIGILAWHVTPMLHRPRPVGRITMMAVAEGERRRGVGRTLVEAAIERLRRKGCGLVEVTSNVGLSAAHAFYRKLGFERTSYRFARTLAEG
jgi:ribosomal protein S18 acetylase RimI-like enzyme